MFHKWICVVAVLMCAYCWSGTLAMGVCPAAPFRPSAGPGTTFTTQCSSVHPSLNPRGAIIWQCLPDLTWEGDWSGCTFPEGVSHAVAPLAYRVTANMTVVQNSIQTIISEVQALLQTVTLPTFGDIHVAYIGLGDGPEETILVLTLQVEEFFSRDSFQRLEMASRFGNFTLVGRNATPVWSGGPALRAYNLCNCPILWSSLQPTLAPGQPIVYLCTTPSYIEATCSCQDLLNDTTCDCTSAFETRVYQTLGRVCRYDPPRDDCMNPMLCVNGNCTITIGGYNCACDSGWSGVNCTEDINECSLFPCQNGGTCNNSMGSFSCNCPPEWTGSNCQTDVNVCSNNPCVNGDCRNIPGNFVCICDEGWTDTLCDADINECNLWPPRCQNNGTCVNTEASFNCTCPPQWTGSSCTTDLTHVTSLNLTSTHGVTLATGDGLVLTCHAGTGSSQTAYFDVVWRLNGTVISSDDPEITISFSDYKHYLHMDPIINRYSGTYTCELESDATIIASQSITVNPGCPPHVFVPYTPVGQQWEVDCSQAHPNLRGVMWWECVSDLTWDGELSGCTFEEDVDREVALLHYLLSGNEAVLRSKQSDILNEMMAHVNQIFNPDAVYNLYAEEVSRFSRNSTILVFALELNINSSSIADFNALHTRVNGTQSLGGLAAAPYTYLAGTVVITPNDTCRCPIFYRDFRSQLKEPNSFKQLQFCRGPSYVRTPCLCSSFLSADSCNCSGVYTMVEAMDGKMSCAEDTDGDGMPNSEDQCEGCCMGESSEGFMWPRTAHELESRQSCALLHPRFNEETYVRRRCSDKGKWLPLDVTQCVFKEPTRLAVVIVVATVAAAEEEIKQQTGDLKNQILAYFVDYDPRNASISSYSPGNTVNQTVVTLSVEFPEDVRDDVIQIFSRTKRDLTIEGSPYVYGFRPANECACLPPGEEANTSTLIEVCNGSPLSPCLCTVASGCKCQDPFVSVSTESDPHVKCSLDSDGDGIPDHLDAEPFVHNSNKQNDSNCQATVQAPCPADTTLSPDISWTETAPCMRNVQRCSQLLNETIGLAYRLCSGSGLWEEPDVRECQSVTFRNIETTVNEVVAAILDTPTVTEGGTLVLQPSHIELLANTTQTLLDATAPSSSSGLLPGDLNTAVGYLNSLASISEASSLFSSPNYTETNLFSVTSNILGAENDGSWEAINSTDNSSTNAAVSLFNSTETLTRSFAQNLSPGDRINFTSDNLIVEAWSVSSVSVQDLDIDRSETRNASVFIPEDLLQQQGNGTAVVVSFVSRLSERLPQQFANQSSLNGNLTVIVSVQVGNMEQLPALGESTVQLTFENIPDESTVSCLFLDEQNGTTMAAVWSGDGLTTSHSTANRAVTCIVHHLTGFAVLVSQARVPPHLPFQVISYIGCAISLLCLIATIIFLLTLRRELLKKLNNFVHLNLCIALACGLLVFLVGIEGAKSVDIACKIIAFLLHYFFLAAFFWMLCEAVMMYNLLVKVFHANERRWVYIYLALGWVTPLLIAVISVAIRHEQYLVKLKANDETIACWLSTVNGTIYAFIVPMLLVLLVNAVLLVFIFRSLFKFYRDSRRMHFKADKAENEAKFLTWELFKAFIILLPLLGFTWIIGLFAVNEETIVFAWLFVILNSLQGAAIFFFYVLRNDKVRPKIVACFKRFYRIREYVYHRKVSFTGVPPTESMQHLATSSPDTARRDLSTLTPTSTLQSNKSDMMDSSHFESHFDSAHDADEERDEVQEAVLTFANDGDAPSGSDRKTSTISVTLREEVIKSSASYPKKN